MSDEEKDWREDGPGDSEGSHREPSGEGGPPADDHLHAVPPRATRRTGRSLMRPRRSSKHPTRFNPWGLVLYLAIVAACAVAGAYMGHVVANMPIMDIEEAVGTYQQNINTRILDGSGEGTLGELAEERRVLIAYEEVPRDFIHALIVAEDKDFLRHHGVDVFGISRAFWANITSGRVVQGGSTISQQLIRNLFLSPEQTYQRKIKEAVLALQLEAKYTKEEILGFYCNTIYFGHQRYGLEAATRYYFGHDATELTLAESALLAAIIRGPEIYTPYRHPERALARRDALLERMAEQGYISEAEARAAASVPLELRERRRQRQLGSYFIEEVRKFLVDRFDRQLAYGGGLRVYTTLDPQMQRAAERAVRIGLYELSMRQRLRPATTNVLDEGGSLERFSHPDWERAPEAGDYLHALVTEVAREGATLRIGETELVIKSRCLPRTMATAEQLADLTRALRPGDVVPLRVNELDDERRPLAVTLTQEPNTEGALVAIEIGTGRVLAMVGGFDFESSQFNCAVQARRQTGSAFKPIVLSAALEENTATLATTIFDEPTVFDDPGMPELYEPENYHFEYVGITTVRGLIEHSRNIPAIKLMVHTGLEETIAVARRMGVEAELPPIYSLALGSIEMSLLELTTVFSVFPNEGVLVEPHLIARIDDRDGRTIHEHTPLPRTAIGRDTAFLVTQALIGVVQRGTAAGVQGGARELMARLGVPLAGKTGTTDDYTDAWFVGFSPQIVCGVWVGNSEELVTIGDDETGARAALPIWTRFMERALQPQRQRTVAEYAVPANIVAVQVDHRNGLLASAFTPESETIFEFFREGTEPTQATTLNDDFNLRVSPIRLMERRVDIRFDNHAVVKRREVVDTRR